MTTRTVTASRSGTLCNTALTFVLIIHFIITRVTQAKVFDVRDRTRSDARLPTESAEDSDGS